MGLPFGAFSHLKLLESLRKKGVPVDGLGFQAHLNLRKGHISEAKLSEFLREVSDLGLEIVVTELDVKEANYAAGTAQRDREVADAVWRFMDVAMSFRSVKGVSTWGLSDRYSWLEVTGEELASYTGAWKDGTGPGLNRGLPLDANMVPKGFHSEMSSALSRLDSQNE